MITITMDKSEARSGMGALLEQQGAIVKSADLAAGDYVLGEGVGVERKTAVDFIQGIVGKERRLFNQARQMKAAYPRAAVVLIEGDPYGTRSRIHPNAITGALSYLAIIEGLTVFQTRSTQDAAVMLFTMARHAQVGLGYDVRLRSTPAPDPDAIVEHLVEGLPGVGPTSAQALLAHFGSAAAVFSASGEELALAPGIGPATAQRIRLALSHPYCR